MCELGPWQKANLLRVVFQGVRCSGQRATSRPEHHSPEPIGAARQAKR